MLAQKSIQAAVQSAARFESLESRQLHSVGYGGLDPSLFDPFYTPPVQMPAFPTTETPTSVGPFDGKKAKTATGRITSTNKVDLVKFTISKRMKISIDLQGITQDADLVLFDSKHHATAYSAKDGVVNEHIGKTLKAGTYYAAVYYWNGNTNYTVRLSQKK